MLIKQLWKEFRTDFEYQNIYGKYVYSNKPTNKRIGLEIERKDKNSI